MIWPAQDALLAGLVGPAGRSAVFAVRHASLNAGPGRGRARRRGRGPGRAAGHVHRRLPGRRGLLPGLPAGAGLPRPVEGRRRGRRGPPGSRGAGRRGGRAARGRGGLRQVLRDRMFLRVWLLTALIVTVSFGQSDASFPGYATRPGGISPATSAWRSRPTRSPWWGRSCSCCDGWPGTAAPPARPWPPGLGAGLGPGHRRRPPGRRRARRGHVHRRHGRLRRGREPAVAHAAGDHQRPGPAGGRGRYNGLGTLAFTTGFLVGPASGAAALGAGWGTGLFAVLIAACVLAGAGASGWAAACRPPPTRSPRPRSRGPAKIMRCLTRLACLDTVRPETDALRR